MPQNKTPASNTNKRIIGFVKNGKYISGKIDDETMQHREHSLHRQYVKDRMREDYAKDIVQPYKNGQLNTEYIEAWGKEDETVKDYVK